MSAATAFRTPELTCDRPRALAVRRSPGAVSPLAAERYARHWGIGATVFLHLAAIVLLLRMEGVREPITPPPPLMVNVIEAPKRLDPVVEPPKPKPVVKQPLPQPKRPVRAPDPVPDPVPDPPPTLNDVVIASSAPSSTAREVPAAAGPAAPQPVVEAPAPKPAPVVEPRFDAAYLNNPAPLYPSVSRRLGEQGRVLLRVHVDEQGMPTSVVLRASSGHERLDDVALKTVRRWKFVPARRGEAAVSAWVIVPIVFNLRS